LIDIGAQTAQPEEGGGGKGEVVVTGKDRDFTMVSMSPLIAAAFSGEKSGRRSPSPENEEAAVETDLASSCPAPALVPPVILISSSRSRVTCRRGGGGWGVMGMERGGRTNIFPVGSPGALSIQTHSVAHVFLQTAAVPEHRLLAENHAGVGPEPGGGREVVAG
jgi:hypothetical protein